MERSLYRVLWLLGAALGGKASEPPGGANLLQGARARWGADWRAGRLMCLEVDVENE